MAKAKSKTLTAKNLKNQLWDTLKDVQSGSMCPNQAKAVATAGREILRTVKIQIDICKQTERNIPTEVIDFAEK